MVQHIVRARTWYVLLTYVIYLITYNKNLLDFSPTDLNRLSTIPFVPLETQSQVTWLPPSQCYLGGNSNDKFHSKLFVFIDFGTAGNAFLTTCGTRQEPSVEEVARILLADPHKFYKLAQGPTQYVFIKSYQQHSLIRQISCRITQHRSELSANYIWNLVYHEKVTYFTGISASTPSSGKEGKPLNR